MAFLDTNILEIYWWSL